MPTHPDKVLARLTDSKKYTGSHQHRFDSSGKGRGLAGRDRVAKGAGTVHVAHTGGPIKDISQVMRPNLRAGSPATNKPQRPRSARATGKARPCAWKECANKSSPVSVAGFCSYHQWKKSENSAYPKQEDAETALTKARRPRHRRQASALCSIRTCGNDRSSKSESGWCEFHVANPPTKEDQEMPEPVAMPPLHEQNCVMNDCDGARFKLGYCSKHFRQMMESDNSFNTDTPINEAPKSSGRSPSSKNKADETLSRLTDPSLFTGSHQHRFDHATGQGLGLAGRDSVMKGGSGYAKYHDGPVRDLSQMVRPDLH